MRVQEIWRFPVKSMQGERIEAAELEPQGLRGDRAFALFDTETGLGLTARRVPQLLFAAAAYRNDGALTITLPDGTTADDDRALSDWLGRPVTLRAAAEPGERVFENPADFEHDAVWEPFRGSTGAFHDSGKVHVSLLSRGLAAAALPRQRSPRRGRRGRAGPLPGWPRRCGAVCPAADHSLRHGHPAAARGRRRTY